MARRNPNMANLKSGYLFPEIGRRKKAYLEKNPDADLISLGIGDTTEPLVPAVTAALKDAAAGMGTPDGYHGYEDSGVGYEELRQLIASSLYNGIIDADEVYVSDGAKCDIGRLQVLFGSSPSVALQNPAYPVYIDGSVIAGCASDYNGETGRFNDIHYMDCLPENGFFPDLDGAPQTDLIYWCSPNNPTGAVSTREQLEQLVAFARKNGSIILFDSAYASYIRDESLPKSIYEIDGAREVAIETSSFSKLAGFTGLRLGWTVVPSELKYSSGEPVGPDWKRIVCTLFNGASSVIQAAGAAALQEQGRQELRAQQDYYLGNARIIADMLQDLGITTYGGSNAPYVWARFPDRDSWDVFNELLEKAHVVCTPGAGFGSAGQGFVRFSSFGHRDNVEKAVERIRKNFS